MSSTPEHVASDRHRHEPVHERDEQVVDEEEYCDEEDFFEEEEEEEEEDFDDEDDDDEAEGLRVRALPADGEPDYDAGPPVDGLEYLRRVRHEASKVPDVMIATTLNPRAFDHKRTELHAQPSSELHAQLSSIVSYEPPETPKHAKPDPRWRTTFLASFSDLRAAVSRARSRAVAVAGQHARHGDSNGGGGGGGMRVSLTEASEAALESFRRRRRACEDEESSGEDDDEEEDDSSLLSPLLSQLLAVDEVTAGALLRRHGIAMEKDLLEEEEEEEEEKREQVEKTGGEVSQSQSRRHRRSWRRALVRLRRRAAWFYALSARVGLPLDAETSAAVRAAARGLARARSRTTSADDPSLPHLQVCLAVAGKYFGQAEPEDE